AHLGVETYKLLLTEYLQQSSRDKSGVMCQDERIGVATPIGFARAVLEAKFGPMEVVHGYVKYPPDQAEELRKATKGVLGMLHFADYRSPVLLEALGDLLMTGDLEANST